MYTNYNGNLEKNQMLTPPIIGLTSSIVNDKLNNITLEDNSSSELFTTNDDKTAIQTKDGIPLEATQFNISSTNEDNNNKFRLKIYYAPTTKSNHLAIYQENNSGIVYFNKDRIFCGVPCSFSWNKGLKFNTTTIGEVSYSSYPSGYLINLVPSNTTTAQMNEMTRRNILDNVCPTYQYCENTYAKKTGSSTQYTQYYQNSTDNKNLYIRNITSQAKGSHFEIPIPSRITTNVILISVKIAIRCFHYFKYLPNLYCSLNTKTGYNGVDDPTTAADRKSVV